MENLTTTLTPQAFIKLTGRGKFQDLLRVFELDTSKSEVIQDSLSVLDLQKTYNLNAINKLDMIVISVDDAEEYLQVIVDYDDGLIQREIDLPVQRFFMWEVGGIGEYLKSIKVQTTNSSPVNFQVLLLQYP